MDLELVQLDEAAGVEQQLDALARGQLALGVLLLDPLLAAAQLGLRVERGQLVAWIQPGEALGALRGGDAARGLGGRGLGGALVGHGARNVL